MPTFPKDLERLGRALFNGIAAVPLTTNPRLVSAGIMTAILYATKTQAFSSIAANSSQDQTVTVTGAAVGDFCECTHDQAIPTGVELSCNVTAADTATVRAQNSTAGTPSIASGTLSVLVKRVVASV